MSVQHISAITLAVRRMDRAVDFYREKVGLEMLYGGESASFTSFRVGGGLFEFDPGFRGWLELVGAGDFPRGRRRRSVPPSG